MKEVSIIFIAVLVGIGSLTYYAYRCGQRETEKEIIQRALQLDKDCYTNQDIETIIFNESQL